MAVALVISTQVSTMARKREEVHFGQMGNHATAT
jgi:hypothetical protein